MRKVVQEVTSPVLQFCSATWGQGGLGRITGALPGWPVIAEVTELVGPGRGCPEEQPQQEWGGGLPARRAALHPTSPRPRAWSPELGGLGAAPQLPCKRFRVSKS